MTHDEAISYLVRVAEWFEAKSINTYGEVVIKMSSMARDRIVHNLRDIIKLVDPPPPVGNCRHKHHAPTCRCGDL